MTDNAHQAKLEAARRKYSKMSKEMLNGIVLGVFLGAKGRIWRDHKGYHARIWASHPIALIPFEILLGAHIHSMAKGKVVANINKKASVEWLQRSISRLAPGRVPAEFEPLSSGRPKKCKHCGKPTNNHHPECYDAIQEQGST